MDSTEKSLVTAGGRITCLRCIAMSKRSRLQCKKPALKVSKTQKCEFHGGRSTGPKTADGKARIGEAHLIHGRDTNERRRERSQGALKLAQLEDVMHTVGMTTATRTAGRKPSGYQAIRTLEEATAWAVEDVLRQVKGGKAE